MSGRDVTKEIPEPQIAMVWQNVLGKNYSINAPLLRLHLLVPDKG